MSDQKLNSDISSSDKQTDSEKNCIENYVFNQTESAPGACPAATPPIAAGYSPYSYTPYKRKEQDDILKHTSSRQALLVVVLCWIFGISFSEIFLNGGFGVSVPILILLFYIIVFWYFSRKEKAPAKSSLILLIPIAILSLGYFLHENPATWIINTLMLLALIPLQLSIMSGTSAGPVFSLQSVCQAFISAIVRPLSFLDAPFKALSKNIRHGKRSANSMMVIWGLVIALPIAGIFIALFSQADSAFRYFADQIFSKINFNFGNIAFDLFSGTIAALFFSSLLITMRARKAPKEREIRIAARINGLLTATVLFMVNLVQITFVLIQFGYLFAGMKLPDNMSYATYARSGFFQLCGVLCLSVVLIMLCLLFVKKDESRRLPKAVSVLLTLFISCNYVIIASAIYRMSAYIAAYDLSVKRVMVTWLILVFALCMIGALIKIWAPKFHALSYIAITVIAMVAVLNFVNISALVADYNVDYYIQSRNTQTVRNIDVSYLGTLGSSAVKATVKLYENSNDKIKTDAMKVLANQKNDLNQKSWKTFCLSDMEADRILETVNIPSYF